MKEVTEAEISAHLKDLSPLRGFVLYTYCVGQGKTVRFGPGSALCLHPDCEWCVSVRNLIKKKLSYGE